MLPVALLACTGHAEPPLSVYRPTAQAARAEACGVPDGVPAPPTTFLQQAMAQEPAAPDATQVRSCARRQGRGRAAGDDGGGVVLAPSIAMVEASPAHRGS
jgi:hypothetical protein